MERRQGTSSPVVRSGAAYRNRIIAISAAISVSAVAMISLYLYALLQLPAEQWRGFAWIVGGLFLVLFAAQDRIHKGLWRPLVRCLDLRLAGRATPEDVRAGFAAISDLPRAIFGWGGFWWGLGGVLVAGGMLLSFDTFSLFSATVMVVGALSGGFVMTVFHYFAMKRILQPVREMLASENAPEDRAGLVRPIASAPGRALTGPSRR